jgi:hypothetical protein
LKGSDRIVAPCPCVSSPWLAIALPSSRASPCGLPDCVSFSYSLPLFVRLATSPSINLSSATRPTLLILAQGARSRHTAYLVLLHGQMGVFLLAPCPWTTASTAVQLRKAAKRQSGDTGGKAVETSDDGTRAVDFESEEKTRESWGSVAPEGNRLGCSTRRKCSPSPCRCDHTGWFIFSSSDEPLQNGTRQCGSCKPNI